MGLLFEFIKSNFLEISVIFIIVLAFVIYLYWKIQKKGLKPVIVDFIIKAENLFKQGENDEKMNYVIDKIIGLIPFPFSLFFTRGLVKNLIQSVFDEIKKALDYNPNEQLIEEESEQIEE